MKKAKYSRVRDYIRSGDVIAFSGIGPISEMIKHMTRSNYSHVGIVLSANVIEDISLVQVIESTSLGKGFAGVKINRLSDHIRDYLGDIYWLPIKEEIRRQINLVDLMSFLLKQKGKKYDYIQAIGSGIDFLPDNVEDLSEIFCSELVMAAFKHVGVAGTEEVNASECTPADICGYDWYKEVVHIN